MLFCEPLAASWASLIVRWRDSFSCPYIGRNSSHVAKHPWRVERGATGWLTASCQAVSLHVICVLYIQTPKGQLSSILPGPARLVLPARRTRDPMRSIRCQRQDTRIAGSTAVSRYLRPRQRCLVHAWDFLSPLANGCSILPNSSPKQRPPPGLRVGARLFSPPRTAVTNRRDYKQMGPQPFRLWRH